MHHFETMQYLGIEIGHVLRLLAVKERHMPAYLITSESLLLSAGDSHQFTKTHHTKGPPKILIKPLSGHAASPS